MMRKILMCLLVLMLLPLCVFAGVIQLPQTGQTSCWDEIGNVISCAGTGQDGELRAGVAWPNPRFVVQGECVTDNLTGLMWPRNGNLAGNCTWQDALDFAADLDLCGYSDWRLPNVNELESLVDAEQVDSAAWLNGQGFTGVQARNYWSSSTSADYSDGAWVVSMDMGQLSTGGKDYGLVLVWPVRAGQ